MTVVSNWNKAKNELVEAARAAKIDPEIMVRIAHLESRFGSDARPISNNPSKNTIRQFDGTMAISSAHGYGQFIDETWKGVLIQYGDKYGVENAASLTDSQVKALRTDTKLQAAMLAEFTRDNIAKGERLGGPNKDANVYAFHNLGDSGAEKILNALKENPNQKVSDVLSSRTISNNPGLYKDGTITVQQAYNNMALEMGRADVYVRNINSQEVLQESSISKSSSVLIKGSRGDAVRDLQAKLNALYPDKTPLETKTGIFGDQTKAALEAFQKDHGLAVDGKAGPATFAKLAELLGKEKTADLPPIDLVSTPQSEIENPEAERAQLEEKLAQVQSHEAELQKQLADLDAKALDQIQSPPQQDIKIDLLEIPNKTIDLRMTESGIKLNINGKDYDLSQFNQMQSGSSEIESVYRNPSNTLLGKYEHGSDQFSIFQKNGYGADKVAVINDFSQQTAISLVGIEAMKTQSLAQQKSAGVER